MFQKLVVGAIAAVSFVLIYYRYTNHNFYRNLFMLEEAFEGEWDFIPLCKNILAKVIFRLECDGGLLYWYEEGQNDYKLKTLQGIAAAKIGPLTKLLRHPHGILERLQQEPEGFIINELSTDQWIKTLAELKLDGWNNFIIMPLRNKNRIAGVFILVNSKQRTPKKWLKLLGTFASRAVVQLDNVRLYQLTKETAQENARLYLNLSKLYHQATSDELTGLFNRNFMMQRLREEIKKARRFAQPLALIFTDIDFFKQINDVHGHQSGDILLTEFGDLLRNSIREYDVACRFGGEEFIIILPHTKEENACELADRLRIQIENRSFANSENPLKITASFGVSALPILSSHPLPTHDEIETVIDGLIAGADEALYQAKQSGRNQVRFAPYSFQKKRKKMYYSGKVNQKTI